MEPNQILVTKWWHTGRNYQKGIMLLTQYCKNKVLVHSLMKKSERFGRNKLEYELPKAVGLNFKQMPELSDNIETDVLTDNDEIPVVISQPIIPAPVIKHIPIVSEKAIGDYPKIIRRIKYEYSDLYKQRSVLHKKMSDIPGVNTEFNNKARATLLNDMNIMSARMDFLHQFIQDYEKNGTMPVEELVWPKPKTENKLPDDIKLLRKTKQVYQTSNYKDKNILRFQQIKKGDKENPLPDGPKRKKIELRIKKRLLEIERIDTKILELQNSAG